MTQYIELDWEESFQSLYGSPIIIPPNTLLWRGYDNRYDVIPDRYTYYSGMEIAKEYAKKENRQLGCFVTAQPLHLIDMRFMTALLERIIQTNEDNEYLNDFAAIIISFGLCSLGHQIELLKERYKEALKASTTDTTQLKQNINAIIKKYKPRNIIEQKGVRVAETTNDGITMAFLQELFKGIFDGFISSRIYTAFHAEKSGQLSPEMILFSPKISNIIQIKRYPENVILKDISIFMNDKRKLINILAPKAGDKILLQTFLVGGGKLKYNKRHYLDEIEDRLNARDAAAMDYYEAAKNAGKRWRKTIGIYSGGELKYMVTPFTKSILD